MFAILALVIFLVAFVLECTSHPDLIQLLVIGGLTLLAAHFVFPGTFPPLNRQ